MAQPDFNALAQSLTMISQEFIRFQNVPAFNVQNDFDQIHQQLQHIGNSIQGLQQRLQDLEQGQDNLQQNQEDLQNEFRLMGQDMVYMEYKTIVRVANSHASDNDYPLVQMNMLNADHPHVKFPATKGVIETLSRDELDELFVAYGVQAGAAEGVEAKRTQFAQFIGLPK